jgi:aryl-alcohol dehydrogenase-like predicted oxidoreductase
MSIGEAWKDFMGSMTKEQSFELLDAFFEAGGNAIDTANIYREVPVLSRVIAYCLRDSLFLEDDQSEEWIGEWMEARGLRDQIIVATKYGST